MVEANGPAFVGEVLSGPTGLVAGRPPAGRAEADDPTVDDVAQLLSARAVRSLYQPIVSTVDGEIVGYEALARMRGPVSCGPDRWLAAAALAGRRADLELLCLEAAVAEGLPPRNARLFVNISPFLLGDARVARILGGIEDRLVLELSETEIISDYDRVRLDAAAWMSRGAELAIDDAGSGYASLRHVLQLCPDYIKLDRSLVDGIQRDRNRQALMNAMVAFARTLGASVIAEGVEHAAELEVLRANGVGHVQGYLLARPAPAWCRAANPADTVARGSMPVADAVDGGSSVGEGGATPDGEDAARRRVRERREQLARLERRLQRATDMRTASAAVVDHLALLHRLWPSVYLLDGDRLRCQAQRGLWQVLDGLRPGSGITGRCYLEGREFVVDDVTRSGSYLEAIPGVRSEVCVPVRVEGVVVGALNAESRVPIDDEALADVRMCAELLGERLAAVGRSSGGSAYDRLGSQIRCLSDERHPDALLRRLVDGARHVSGLDSAMATRHTLEGELGIWPSGPLRHALESLAPAELRQLVLLVDGMTSCYTAGATLDHGIIPLAALRRNGVRALVIVPLVSGEERRGLLLVAHSTSCAFTSREIEPLEVLATHAASALAALAPPVGVPRSVLAEGELLRGAVGRDHREDRFVER